MTDAINNLYALERLSFGDTFVHRLGAMSKLLSTFCFLIFVLSFGPYSAVRLASYIFYPTLLMAFSHTPYSILLKRFFVVLPFCLLASLPNMLIEAIRGEVDLYGGLLNFFTILLRAYLCVMAVFVLVSSTPPYKLYRALRFLGLPRIFILTLEMTYRYIAVLMLEANSMLLAYKLRGPEKGGVKFADMGSFTGNFLLRSIDRAERVFNAMKLRGLSSEYAPTREKCFSRADLLYLTISLPYIVLSRFIDINSLFSGVII